MVFRVWVSAVAATALLVSCAPSTSPDTTELPSGTGAPNAETTAPVSTTLTPPAPTTSQPGRETAPDFTLRLGNGSTFTLSAEPRPIFMVFWAEW